jgi:hypothetical protein
MVEIHDRIAMHAAPGIRVLKPRRTYPSRLRALLSSRRILSNSSGSFDFRAASHNFLQVSCSLSAIVQLLQTFAFCRPFRRCGHRRSLQPQNQRPPSLPRTRSNLSTAYPRRAATCSLLKRFLISLWITTLIRFYSQQLSVKVPNTNGRRRCCRP